MIAHLLERVRRINDSGFDLVLLSEAGRAEAYALPAAPVGQMHVASSTGGSGPAAVAQAVDALADAVEASTAARAGRSAEGVVLSI